MSHDHEVSRAMFVDHIELQVIAGAGGHGCMSFRREKYIPKGGPDGGDGAGGGSVFVTADPQLTTLHHLAGRHHWKAQRGGHGMGKNRHGKRGEDLEIPVPPGTEVFDADRGHRLADLTEPGQRVRVARGGRGGRGNTSYKTATNQAPREFEEGTPGEERRLRLELKLIADVGLLGLPNAGKSTLLSRMTAAKPKVADYPFTTLQPQLGVVELPGGRRFVMADIPGLIEGAHGGAGLGDEFLRHIERTTALVHVVDIAPSAGTPAGNYHAIRSELQQFSPALAEKPELLVANKLDLTDAEFLLDEFREEIGREIVGISAVTGRGIDALAEAAWRLLHPSELE